MPRSFSWPSVLSLAALALLGGATPKPDSVNQRREAVLTLSQKLDPANGPALIKALDDKDGYVRTLALRGLMMLRYQGAGPRVAELLGNDTSRDVRQSAALCLGAIRAPESLQALIKGLKDSEEAVRSSVAISLASLKDSEAVPALAEVQNDPSLVVRRSAVTALSRIATPEAQLALESFKKDSDLVVQQIALEGLKKKKVK